MLYKPECDSTRGLYLYMLRAKGLWYINPSGILTKLKGKVYQTNFIVLLWFENAQSADIKLNKRPQYKIVDKKPLL